ncbi:MAG: hypothetical protein QUS33_02770 [Dehalococcoidia bacterium]|nr:hypothetical protein [Dehalococcoidia bacterium]
MGDSNELIEVALTVLIALAVGFSVASFGQDSAATGSSDESRRMRALTDLTDKMVRTLTPRGPVPANPPPQAHVET